MRLYDMHSHILPGFDDGAQNIAESLSLLECLNAQEVNNVCLTPHFYTNEMSAIDFVEKRNEAFRKFLPYIPQGLNVVLGAEVFVTKYLFTNRDFSKLTYGKSNFILTEFAYSSTFSERTFKYFRKLIEEHGLTPVIPHVERYDALIEDASKIVELKKLGILIQTNIANYAKKSPYFRRRKLLNLINEGYIDILGSDAHSFEHNTPEVFSQAVDCIIDKCDVQRLRSMMDKAEYVFERALYGEIE